MRTFSTSLATVAALVSLATAASPYHNDPNPPKPRGTVDAAYGVISRVLGSGASSHFELRLVDGNCAENVEPPCFALADNATSGRLTVIATGASELTAGVGHYLRQHCNMTIGWPRGGGSNVFVPDTWPKVGTSGVVRRRNVPWSYMMNVCTHSYSLPWCEFECCCHTD